MKLLLDTHTFIWWNCNVNELSANAFSAIQNEENDVIVSMVIFWEMQIKMQIGKLEASRSLREMFDDRRSNFGWLHLDIEHILAINKLPMYHKDLFDRMLIAQAMTENAILVTKDSNITNGYQDYIETLW